MAVLAHGEAMSEPTDRPETGIGGIGNYYGGLWVKIEDGEGAWGIENYDGIGWEPCPVPLVRALLDYEASRV